MSLSTNFPASGRAAGEARVIKLDVTAYYTLAAMAPSVPDRIGGLARAYLDSLQELASEQPEVEARVLGPRLDAKVRDLSTFLTRNHVPFDRVTIDAPVAGAQYPVLELRDGTRLEDPVMRDVARAVGLEVAPADDDYDVVILGGGPAGLTAAVNGAAEGLRTVVVECLAPGGQAGTSTRIENYTGFPYGISGDDLAGRALTQARRLGAEIVATRTARMIDTHSHEVVLDGGDRVRAAAVIIATGVEWRTLPLPSVERFLGNGLYYGAALAQGQDICIVGAGNSAGQAAIFFSHHARSVTMLVRGPSLDSRMSRYLIEQIEANAAIRVQVSSQIAALHGDTALEPAEALDTATGRSLLIPFAAVFVMIGADAVTDWLPREVACDSRGFILTGVMLPPCHSGNPDAGRSPWRRVPRASLRLAMFVRGRSSAWLPVWGKAEWSSPSRTSIWPWNTEQCDKGTVAEHADPSFCGSAL